jgi:hypothetical protein
MSRKGVFDPRTPEQILEDKRKEDFDALMAVAADVAKKRGFYPS